MIRALINLRRKTDGTAAMQFVIVFPLIMTLFAFACDLGLILMRKVMLERAVDVEVRQIRIGARAADDYTGLREDICAGAMIIPHCQSRLKLELKAMAPRVWEAPGHAPDCESLSEVTITAPRQFDAARSNQLVILRACVVLEPLMPGWGLGQSLLSNGSGSKNRFYQITASTSFVKEPS